MHFHRYRNWQFIGDVWHYRDMLAGYKARHWEGKCEVCGKPKLRKQKIMNSWH